ncbi:unnamed protein product, partial [Mycena citricolor]
SESSRVDSSAAGNQIPDERSLYFLPPPAISNQAVTAARALRRIDTATGIREGPQIMTTSTAHMSFTGPGPHRSIL